MKHPPPTQAYGPAINRVSDLMVHTNRYAFGGVGKLAADAAVSPSSISRLIHGKFNPSFLLVARVTTALEQTLGYRIDPRELVAELGKFLTPHVCDLCGCEGCLPETALDEFGNRKQAFANVQPGRWVTSRYPKGYLSMVKGGAR